MLFISLHLNNLIVNRGRCREHTADGAERLHFVIADDALHFAGVVADVHFRNDHALGVDAGGADLFFRDGPDGIELEQADLVLLVARAANGGQSAAADGTIGHDHGLCIIQEKAFHGRDVIDVVEDLVAVTVDGSGADLRIRAGADTALVMQLDNKIPPESSFPEISSGCRRSYFLSTMKSRQYLAVTVTDLRRNFT